MKYCYWAIKPHFKEEIHMEVSKISADLGTPKTTPVKKQIEKPVENTDEKSAAEDQDSQKIEAQDSDKGSKLKVTA
jgi:hypothetical protein